MKNQVVIYFFSCSVDLSLSARSQGQTTIAMAGKSGRRTRLTVQEELEVLSMLESRSLLSAVIYKFGVSSRFVTKSKSEGAVLLEEEE